MRSLNSTVTVTKIGNVDDKKQDYPPQIETITEKGYFGYFGMDLSLAATTKLCQPDEPMNATMPNHLPKCQTDTLIRRLLRNLSEDFMEEAREVFSLYDLEGDGRVELKNIGKTLRALGLNPREADVKRVCTDLGDRISFEMFIPIYQTLAKEEQKTDREVFIEAFRIFDKDSNGMISAAELRHLMCGLGEALTDYECDQLVSGLEDSKGLVPYEAFVQRVLGSSD
ncbi:Myosin-2 essential light chain [Clonorchis sinensis]|uniref:Myosin-2 essential light chain n=1 Tax=Clonorchis sinensis TaxID=79923 RepID=A0A8T1MQB2_CLOSI|nr:Myosin-2 essential light chain [Clonorchis sinensis]